MRLDRVIFWDFDGTLGYRPENWSGALLVALAAVSPDHGVTLDQIGPFLRDGFPWLTPDAPYLHLCNPDRWWRHLEPVVARAYEGAGIPSPLARDSAARAASERRRDRARPRVRIGDSPDRDVIGARQVGIRGVRFNPLGDVAEGEIPWRVVARLTDLPPLPAGGPPGSVGAL